MSAKGAAKVIDPKDISPAWKVLQMKINEEKVSQCTTESMDTTATSKIMTKTKKKKLNRKRRAEQALAEAEAVTTKKVHYDIPVLVKDDEIGEPTQLLALDCEYVGAGPAGTDDILARVSIVNDKGKIVYDKYVKPTSKITDYRTAVSGIRPENLKDATPFDTVQNEVMKLIRERTIVGHAIHNDFRVLKITHNRKLTRDTAKCDILKKMAQNHNGSPALKTLAQAVLGIEIQRGEHDSITDARVALRIYEAVKKQWEAEIKRYRK